MNFILLQFRLLLLFLIDDSYALWALSEELVVEVEAVIDVVADAGICLL